MILSRQEVAGGVSTVVPKLALFRTRNHSGADHPLVLNCASTHCASAVVPMLAAVKSRYALKLMGGAGICACAVGVLVRVTLGCVCWAKPSPPDTTLSPERLMVRSIPVWTA